MAKARSPLERPKQRAKVLALVLEGKSDAQVAAVMKCSRQAITAFRHRHVDELAPLAEQVNQAIIDVALKDKENRIRELAWLYGLAKAEAEEHGITITETRKEYRRGSEDADEYVTRDFRTGMVKEMRGLLRDIGEELGQYDKGDINIDNRSLVLVRQYGGFDLSAID